MAAGVAIRLFSLLRALGRVSARHVRSFGSLAGQNFFLFVLFVALQPSSAAFFGMLLAVVMLLPMSTDPMQALPEERRATWPIADWEWAVVRVVSVLLSPVVWIGIGLMVRVGWQAGAMALGGGVAVQGFTWLARRVPGGFSGNWLRWVPALPGTIGAIMRLQWRGMLRTLDPYVALLLMGATVAYRMTGRPLDAEAPHIMALVVALAVSTHSQVLLGIDGRGAELNTANSPALRRPCWEETPANAILSLDLRIFWQKNLTTWELYPGISVKPPSGTTYLGRARA
ncbi:MAG: hypothetical protein ABI995_08300 [Acidobacteriota bacterium]